MIAHLQHSFYFIQICGPSVWLVWHSAPVDSIILVRQDIPCCVWRCAVVHCLRYVLGSASLNGRAPPYLSEHCIPVSSADTRRHLRSANRHLLAVPPFPLNTYGRRAFSVAGPMAWNSLPGFIRDPTSSTDCFRRLLKTYLFARY